MERGRGLHTGSDPHERQPLLGKAAPERRKELPSNSNPRVALSSSLPNSSSSSSAPSRSSSSSTSSATRTTDASGAPPTAASAAPRSSSSVSQNDPRLQGGDSRFHTKDVSIGIGISSASTPEIVPEIDSTDSGDDVDLGRIKHRRPLSANGTGSDDEREWSGDSHSGSASGGTGARRGFFSRGRGNDTSGTRTPSKARQKPAPAYARPVARAKLILRAVEDVTMKTGEFGSCSVQPFLPGKALLPALWLPPRGGDLCDD